MKQDLIAADPMSATSITRWSLERLDVSAETLKANASLRDARKAYQAGDYGAARARLGSCEPPSPRRTGTQPLPRRLPEPDEDRKQATVHTTNPETG